MLKCALFLETFRSHHSSGLARNQVECAECDVRDDQTAARQLVFQLHPAQPEDQPQPQVRSLRYFLMSHAALTAAGGDTV